MMNKDKRLVAILLLSFAVLMSLPWLVPHVGALALVAIVLLNLCGCTFSTPNFLPISRNRNSTPLSVNLLCGLFNDTNNALLSSVLDSI